MARKKTENYWASRLSAFKMSFSNNSLGDWTKLFAIDAVFLIAFSILLTFMIIFSALQIKSADSIAEGLMPTMTALQAGNKNSMEKSLERVDSGLKTIMNRIIGSFIISYLLFAVFVGSWAYVGLSKTLGVKMLLKRWLVFSGISVVWLVSGAGIIIFPLAFVFKGLASIILSILLIFLVSYLTIIFFYSMIISGLKDLSKNIINIGLRNIHKMGFAFMIVLLFLLMIDALFIFSKIPFRTGGALLSVVLMVLFISWSRQYLCIEMEEVAKNA